MLQEATKALNSAFNNSFIKKISQYLHDCVREEVKSSTFRNLKGDKDNKWIFLQGEEELFTHKNPLIRFLVISLGSFAVNREKPERATLKTIKDIVNKTNWQMGMFPQGKTVTEGDLFADVKSGFVSLAKLAKMDIVPIAICGFDGYAILPFSKHLTLKIGKPISYELPEEEITKQWINYMKENLNV